MRWSVLFPLLVSLALVSVAGCGGPGNVGEACSRPGSTADCVDGAVCATDESTEGTAGEPVWESYTCRATCDEQSDCNAGEECRGVTGAAMLSACQPERTP